MLLVTSIMLALAATPLAGQALAARATDPGEQVRLLRCLFERGFALLTGRWPPSSTSPPAPEPDRRHRPRSARPQRLRAWLHHMNFARITSVRQALPESAP